MIERIWLQECRKYGWGDDESNKKIHIRLMCIEREAA
jgi:hypothetical protein